jgi:predicted peroxiredoxin
MKITYFASAGTADPTRASIPLHLAANGSVEVGQETTIILGGDATELLIADNAQRLEGLGVPPARELWPSCANTRSPCLSERAAPSPVGRPTRT